jgi:hypothetical protein
MLKRLLQFALELPQDQLGMLSLEDMALCVVCYDLLRDTPEEARAYDKFPEVLEVWLQEKAYQETPLRALPLLDALCTHAEEVSLYDFARDELELLHITGNLFNQAGNPERWDSMMDRLDPFLAQVQELRMRSRTTSDFAGISARLRLVLPEDLKTGQQMRNTIFAGVPTPFSGLESAYDRSVKVLGTLPKDYGLHVADGCAQVFGSVCGHIAAQQDCECADAVTGAMVSHTGSIRAATIELGAVVVAKEGDIRCREVSHAERLYAHGRIHIAGNLRQSLCITSRLDVKEEVIGGLLHVAGPARAYRFRQGESGPLRVLLHKSISCEDYGEIIPKAGQNAYREVMERSRIADRLRRSMLILQQEADEYAGHALLYLLSSESETDGLHHLESLQGRLAFAKCLKEGIISMAALLREHLAAVHALGTTYDPHALPNSLETKSALAELDNDLRTLGADNMAGRDLQKMRAEAQKAYQQAMRKNQPTWKIHKYARILEHHEEELNTKIFHLEKQARQAETELGAASERHDILKRARNAGSRVDMLAQLIGATRMRDDLSMASEKLTSPYMKVVLQSMERRQTQATKGQLELLRTERALRDLQEVLREEHHLPSPDYEPDTTGAPPAELCGRFGSGVELYLWSYQLQDHRAEDEEPGSRLIIPNSKDDSVAYRRNPDASIVRI